MEVADADTNVDPQPRLYQRVTEYTISSVPDDLFVDAHLWALQVRHRGADGWSITHLGYALGRDGAWEWEPLPSSRDKEWLGKYRFSEQEALELARHHAPLVKVNGRTTAQVIEFYETLEKEKT